MKRLVWTLALIGLALCREPAHAENSDSDIDEKDESYCHEGHSCLTTGNGFGYATVDPATGMIKRIFAHPYSGVKENPANPGWALPTEVFIYHAVWKNDVKVAVSDPPHFVDQSQVIATARGTLKLQTFMPFGLARNALITTAVQSDGSTESPCLDAVWKKTPLSDTLEERGGRLVRVLKFQGVAETFLAISLDGNALAATSSCAFPGSRGWALMSVDPTQDVTAAVRDLDVWRADEKLENLGMREATELNRWRQTSSVCPISRDEKELFRQSETLLRMAQIREVNNSEHMANGLINASLPAGEWAIPFVRDMAYATVALSDSGHQTEARRALTALLNTPEGRFPEDVNGQRYQISTVRYFGNGIHDADGRPPHRNLELDSWGLSLWSMGEYFGKYQDRAWLAEKTPNGSVYENIRNLIVKPLLANLDVVTDGKGKVVKKDTSAWEQNDEDAAHYAASTIAAISGLKRFLPMASAVGDQRTIDIVRAQLKLLQRGFKTTFMQGSQISGRAREEDPHGRNTVDGAVLEAINQGVVTDPKVIQSTIERMEILKKPSGGYNRVSNPLTEYERHEFVFVDINLARAYLRLGKTDAADAIMAKIIERSKADNHVVPEMYISSKNDTFKGEIGDPTGASPMIGFGAGAVLLYMSERVVAQKQLRVHPHKPVLDLSATHGVSADCGLQARTTFPLAVPFSPAGNHQ